MTPDQLMHLLSAIGIIIGWIIALYSIYSKKESKYTDRSTKVELDLAVLEERVENQGEFLNRIDDKLDRIIKEIK